MSCYFRHMKEVLAEAGIEVTPANRKEIDRAFHQIVGATYKECPEAWKKLKAELAAGGSQRHDLAKRLRELLQP
ncbi:MAG: hypothetical protein HY673_24425 [Chloroflexi bacterium]|nr:hypothetical protein [Chloroflexota bacterium]